MTQYIIRGETDYSNEFDSYGMYFPSRLIIEIMRTLYEYKDVIDYDSVIVFITNEYVRYASPALEVKKMVNVLEKVYKGRSATFCTSSDDTHTSPNNTILFSGYSTAHDPVPMAALLVDKNNTIHRLKLSDELMFVLYTESRFLSGECTCFPIGYFVWQLDLTCKLNDGRIRSNFDNTSVDIPDDLRLFISANRPARPKHTGYKYIYRPQLSKFFDNNIDMIRKDLHIPDAYPGIDYKYISAIAEERAEKEKRRAQLLKELAELNEELDALPSDA